MTANVPVLPIAGSTVLRAALALLALVTRWLKDLARARRHRREARALAGLDRHMLADIGITSADVRDAFSARFWEDPTELLAERAGEGRRRRPSARRAVKRRAIRATASSRQPRAPPRAADDLNGSRKRPTPLIGRAIRTPAKIPSRGRIQRPPGPLPGGRSFFSDARWRSRAAPARGGP